MQSLCFATHNKHKFEEVAHAVRGKFSLVSMMDLKHFEELPETQNTLEGNSLQKAEYVYTHFNIPCFADDTGLEVEALHGEPGVYSARYAGEHKNSNDNINLLLSKLAGVRNRRARFRTIFTLIGLGPTVAFEGVVEGEITAERRGTLGFGYDPVFLPKGFNKTLAEMTMEEKNKISHRAIAVQKLTTFLQNYRAS